MSMGGGTVHLLHVLLSAPHMYVPEYACHHAAYGNAGVALLVGARRCVYTCVCIWCVSECCPTVELLILTSEAAFISLPAPPPASTWKTDRQADRQLSSQLVKLCLP